MCSSINFCEHLLTVAPFGNTDVFFYQLKGCWRWGHVYLHCQKKTRGHLWKAVEDFERRKALIVANLEFWTLCHCGPTEKSAHQGDPAPKENQWHPKGAHLVELIYIGLPKLRASASGVRFLEGKGLLLLSLQTSTSKRGLVIFLFGYMVLLPLPAEAEANCFWGLQDAAIRGPGERGGGPVVIRIFTPSENHRKFLEERAKIEPLKNWL